MKSPKRRCSSLPTTAALSPELNYSSMAVQRRFKSCVPISCRDGARPSLRLLLSLPNKRVEHPRRFIADAFIQRYRSVVGFSYRQRDEMESTVAEIFG